MWLVSVALAHPVGDRAAAQGSSLVIHRDRVDVDYQVDVPTLLVQTARKGGDPVQAMETELASGLLLVIDGAVASMTEREPSPPPVIGPHTVTFALHLVAPLPPGARHVELQTANLQDAQNFYSGDLHLDDGLQLESCSILALDRGRIVRDDTLRWLRGDDRRVLSATLAAPKPGWWRWIVPLRDQPISARAALVPSDPWDRERLTPAIWSATALAGLALGGSGGRSPWAALALAGIPLGAVPYGPILALVAAAIAAGTRRSGALVAAIAGAGLLATVPSLRAALWVGVAFALGSTLTAGASPRLRWAALAVAAGLAILRAR